jgi:thiamine-monophosphate kinase
MSTSSRTDSPAGDPRPEFAFIDWIARQTTSRPEVRLGIGDDAAVLSAPGRDWVSAVDVITAGVHFDDNAEPRQIGRKALAVNLSDLAAMAAVPCAALMGIVLPKNWCRDRAESLYEGMLEIAREFDVSIAGGDTNTWDGPLVISVTLLGLVEQGREIRRDGARAGDWILVTGALGGSLASGRHLTFTPRVREALALRAATDPHAMLDLSDGLGSDLFHLLDRSGVGARIVGESIPIHADVPSDLSPSERLARAIGDGEDFELLMTVSPEEGARLIESSPLSIPLTKIGEITPGPGATLKWKGQEQAMPRSGWFHAFG